MSYFPCLIIKKHYMEFRRKTSSGISSGLSKLLIKLVIFIFVISISVFFIDKIDLPAPHKSIKKIISNDQFKIVK